MLYTQEEKEKIYENLDRIKECLEMLQPRVRDKITVDFGEMKTYANYDREREYHLYLYKDAIRGRVGGLGLDYTRERVSSSTRSTVYQHLDYAVALITNWQYIKRTILNKIEEQNETIAAINSFEV